MMTKGQKWFVLLCFVIGCVLGPLMAQQQFSGGQAVTISGSLPSGSNTIGKIDILGNGGAALDSSPGTSATNAVTVQGSSSGVAIPTSLSSLPALAAGTSLVGKTYPYTGCGTTQVESGSPVGFAVMPTSATTIESATTCVLTLVVTNTGSSSVTYYFTDNQSTPVSVIGSSANPVTILAGERDEYTFPSGAKFNTGIKAAASATGLSYYLLGIQ